MELDSGLQVRTTGKMCTSITCGLELLESNHSTHGVSGTECRKVIGIDVEWLQEPSIAGGETRPAALGFTKDSMSKPIDRITLDGGRGQTDVKRTRIPFPLVPNGEIEAESAS